MASEILEPKDRPEERSTDLTESGSWHGGREKTQETLCSQGRNEARETGSASDIERKSGATGERTEFSLSTEGPVGGK